MDLPTKTQRKRVANFTADEKALLAHIIKKRPIVESKLTDGKSIAKKKAAWDLITQEFNCNPNVHKRETATLKRAWDNMKAFTRKARAEQRGNFPPPPQRGAIISMVEEAAPVMICEVKNAFDSGILDAIVNDQEELLIEKNNKITSVLIDTTDILVTDLKINRRKHKF